MKKVVIISVIIIILSIISVVKINHDYKNQIKYYDYYLNTLNNHTINDEHCMIYLENQHDEISFYDYNIKLYALSTFSDREDFLDMYYIE